MIPATMRVTAKSAGSIATASATVVTFNIGEPTTNASTNWVDAPPRTSDGAIIEEQQEQNGCGSANNAPPNEPARPRRRKSAHDAGRAVSAKPEIRMPSSVACQTVSR